MFLFYNDLIPLLSRKKREAQKGFEFFGIFWERGKKYLNFRADLVIIDVVFICCGRGASAAHKEDPNENHL